jgi:putative endonuclease
MPYFVYIVFNKRNGTIYVGMTNDLARRVCEHKNRMTDGFTKDYCVDKLGYFEAYEDVSDAIKREKQLKRWSRIKKLELLERDNPEWDDLYEKYFGENKD